jgi:hypothetical protein
MERPLKIRAEAVDGNKNYSLQDDGEELKFELEPNSEIKVASDAASIRYFTSYVKNWEANWIKGA